MKYINTKIILIAIVCLAVLACAFAVWKLHSPVASPFNITTTAGNYGLFIDNQDNEYFSTQDANVRNIIQTYIAPQYLNAKTDAMKYGNSLIYYYTKDNFIAAGLTNWSDLNNISGFSMFDAKTGKLISECDILGQAGLYKDADLLLSVSYKDNGVQGVCFYNRGAPNFTFIDLTAQLGKNETLFDDPAGRNLHAGIHDVDTQKQTFFVDVYDTTKKDAKSNYAYKRSIEVSYNDNVKLGIQEPVEPTFHGRSLMVGINSWRGYIDGKYVAVTGTAKSDDPSQGVLFIMEDGSVVGSKTYLSPTATGPLKIVSQQNDILTIQSVAGTYEAYNDDTNYRQNVTTKGGATYFFVLPRREFEQ